MKNKVSILNPIIIALVLLTGLISVATADEEHVDLPLATAATAIKSDDFTQATLAPFWSHIEGVSGDPAPVMNGEEVEITVEHGIEHDIFPPEGNQSSRIMQEAPDSDFEVEVKFTSGVSDTYQMQGILVEQDEDDFLRMEFFGQNGDTYAYAADFDGGVLHLKGKSVIAPGDTSPLYLRVTRQGDDWTYTYSTDGTTWIPFTTFERVMTVNYVGIYAGNKGTPTPPAHTTVADYFHNTANPGPFILTVDSVGNGTVEPDPDNATYPASEFVTVTALPDTGWEFDSWSGDLSGSTNPDQIMMDDDKTAIATFTPIEYSLDVGVNPGGAGAVSKNPDKATYYYDDVVSLTAAAEPGWTFDSWSGDLISTTNPVQVTIDGNKNITANFTRDEYSLTVGAIGNGQVAKDPEKESYFYGDEVTLTATADEDWTFQSWSGDVVSTTNPILVTIQGNSIITATFVEQYQLTLNQIGSGTVVLDPPGGVYSSGTEVLLTPEPDVGWEFDRWDGSDAGDLTDNQDGTWSLIMDTDKTIVVRFKYPQYLPFVGSN